MASGLAPTDVRSLALDPQHPDVVYAGTAGSGVFKSVAGRWARLGDGLDGIVVPALVVDPAVPTRLFAGTIGASVFRLEQDACGDRVVDAGEAVTAEVACQLRQLAGGELCSRGRFARLVRQRLQRAILLLRGAHVGGVRPLRRVDRLLGRLRTRARRLAHKGRLDVACMQAVNAALAPPQATIEGALGRAKRS
jgi:hypothetical protein